MIRKFRFLVFLVCALIYRSARALLYGTRFRARSDFAAISRNGTVVSWGKNVLDPFSRSLDTGNVTAVYSAQSAFAALKQGGEVVTWGDSDYGGDSSSVSSELSANVTAVFSTHYAFAALKQGGEVVTWGPEWGGGDSTHVRTASFYSKDVSRTLAMNDTVQISSTNSAFAALKKGGDLGP